MAVQLTVFASTISDGDYYRAALMGYLRPGRCTSVADAVARAREALANRNTAIDAYLGARASGCTERDAIAAALTDR